MRTIRSLPRSTAAYVRHGWRAILAVTAIVAIAHHHHWLDPIDTYAFFITSYFLGSPPAPDSPPKVVVAAIDSVSYETDYVGRSPLDRCTLSRHLNAIYTAPARPTVVVVDLDLSPVWPRGSVEESACQQRLEDAIAEARRHGTKTVIMQPFTRAVEAAREDVRAWETRMSAAGVVFGAAVLPSRWGLTITHHCRPGSLAGAAYLANPPATFHGTCLAEEAEPLIDTRHYLRGIAVVSTAPASTFAERIGFTLANIRTAPGDPRRVVFLGGTWGEGDTYFTPIGELYGVEVHAASFLSIGDRPREATHLFSTVLELFIAVVSGFLFKVGWHRYFRAARHPNRTERERAVLYLLGLAALVCVLGTIFSVLSWRLLSWGVWLSPIPMILGMAVHAFVEDVTEAADVAREHAPDDRAREHAPHDGAPWSHSVAWFFVGEARSLYRHRAWQAAALVSMKRLAWIVVVAWWLVLVVSPQVVSP